MGTEASLRLREVLEARYQRRGSWDALAKAIGRASGDEKRTVDRRKLKRLVEGDETVSLTIAELRLLDQFLRPLNEGLAEKPIFRREENLLDALVESESVTFFVAARFHPDFGTEAISRWDLRGITRLLRTRLGELELRIQDVMFKEDWERSALRSDSVAVISIGSPLACAATEYVLAEMVGVAPYERGPLERLPFCFVFPGEHTSGFILGRREAARYRAELGELPEGDRALVVAGDVYAGRGTRSGETYALLVAQRRPPAGHVHMALCGLSGPATYALAKVLQDGGINRTLPRLDWGVRPPILVSVLRVGVADSAEPDVSGQSTEERERRQVVTVEVVRPPRLLNIVDGQWYEEKVE